MIDVNNNIFQFNNLETLCNYKGKKYDVVGVFDNKYNCVGYQLLKSDDEFAYKCMNCKEILLGQPKFVEVEIFGEKRIDVYCYNYGAKLYEI